MYTYKKKESANLNDFVKYRTEHVHNAIASATSVVKNVPIVYDVRQLRSINSDIHRLAAWALAFKCTVPKNVMWSGERHVKACTTLLRNTVVDFYESLVVDKPCAYSYATLPPELWELVFNRLDYHNRVNLSETCPYLSQIHDMSPTGKMDAMITWVRKNTCMFQFSPNGYMCASRARSTFLLTDDELHELPVTLVDNPYYKCAAPMRLYDAEDLGVGIYNKYKTPEAFLAERERRQARAIARKNKKC